MDALPPTKLSILLGLMESGKWQQALALAAKFHDLGDHKKQITRAHDALQNPELYKQMGKNPMELLQAGIKALKERYHA